MGNCHYGLERNIDNNEKKMYEMEELGAVKEKDVLAKNRLDGADKCSEEKARYNYMPYYNEPDRK